MSPLEVITPTGKTYFGKRHPSGTVTVGTLSLGVSGEPNGFEMGRVKGLNDKGIEFVGIVRDQGKVQSSDGKGVGLTAGETIVGSNFKITALTEAQYNNLVE
jgi:hypothetical protein